MQVITHARNRDAEEMDAESEVRERSPSPSEAGGDTQVDLVPSAKKYENNAKEEVVETQGHDEVETTKSAEVVERTPAEDNVIAGSSPSPSPQTKSQEAGKKESAGDDSSKQLADSNKLEDQINLQHLVELMKIFYVSS